MPETDRTAALLTGASSGIGAATARRLAEHGASVALVARRLDCLEALAAEIDKAGGTALVVEADITDRTQAEAAVQQAVERFGRLDTLVNNAGLMLLGPVVGADGPSLTPLPPPIPSRTWGMLAASGCRRPPGRERPTARRAWVRQPAWTVLAAGSCVISESLRRYRK